MENTELDLNSGQQTQELELETPAIEAAPQGGDPLDEIQDIDSLRFAAKLVPGYKPELAEKFAALDDPEQLRAEIKKVRAIGQRHLTKKPEPKVEVEKPAIADTPFLKKADFELANQKKAIKLATVVSENDSDEVRALKEDMLENWQSMVQFYTPRRGKDTPEDVFEDIKDAYAVFNTRRPKAKEKPDVSILTETRKTGTGSAPAPKAAPKSSIKIPEKSTPDTWY